MASIIYNDLYESEFLIKYDDLVFVFSSEFYKNKFETMKNDYLKIEQDKLFAKYRTPIFADYVILLELYKSIEKRGFLVYYKNNELKNYSFDFIIKQ